MKTPLIRTAVVLATLVLTTTTQAGGVYRCEQDGHVTFSQVPCGPGGTPADFTPLSSGGSGLRPGERALLNNVRSREAEERAYKRHRYEQDARHHVDYGDRLKIRELEMEKGALTKSLSRGSKSFGERRAIEARIIGIDRQIEQIRAPKW